MRDWITRGSVAFGVFAAMSFAVIGCGDSSKPGAAKDKDKTGTATAKADTKHEGWWCAEHGIPEEECSMCSAKVAKECKAKGDWCKEHDRAESQCFICHPELKEKFAAKYRAKYGKEPPPIENDDKGKKK
jgi:hypothetical protein